jgi:hypothetical protein
MPNLSSSPNDLATLTLFAGLGQKPLGHQTGNANLNMLSNAAAVAAAGTNFGSMGTFSCFPSINNLTPAQQQPQNQVS